MNSQDLQARLRALASPADARFLAGFFKTGPGQYGEGDVFIGVRVPAIRKLANQFRDLPLLEVEQLLHSAVHEDRLAALVILVLQAARADTGLDRPSPATAARSRRSAKAPESSRARKAIYDLYLANARFINNWDLVDLSAPQIVGGYLADRSRRPLYRLARSSWLWDRRISVLATFHFIRRGELADSLKIAELLLADRQDLIHKAVGWMLREVGKRDGAALEQFLTRHCRAMPRTMLRYAIERYPEPQRRRFMARET